MTFKNTNKLTYKNIPYYTIDSNTLSVRELSVHQRKHFLMLNELTEMSAKLDGYMSMGMYDRLIREKYNFQIKVVNDKPYKKEGYTLVSLMLGYCSSKPISLYIENSTLYMFEAVSIDLSIYKPDTLLN